MMKGLTVGMVLILVAGCASDSVHVENVILDDYETLVSVEDNTLAVPSVIRFDGVSKLFVLDKSLGRIVELDLEGQVVQEYGSQGRGPGEFQLVNNLFVTETDLYAVDFLQLVIHRYERGGEAVSPFNYGEISGQGAAPLAPFNNSMLYVENIDNQPLVTPQGDVLMSPGGDSRLSAVFELRDWDSNHLADVGEVPPGSSLVLDLDLHRDDIMARRIPAFNRADVFAVEDGAHPDEFFLVYNAFPRIEKYDAVGQRLWSRDIEKGPVLAEIEDHFFVTMDRMQQADRRSRIDLRYYVAGRSTPYGGLYLATNSTPFQLHEYSPEGNLIRIVDTGTEDLLPVFDIDSVEGRMFIVTKDGEIRAYSM